MGTAYPTLADAARSQRVALVNARERYERSLTAAAAARLTAERAASNAYRIAQDNARGIAQIRRLRWRVCRAMDTDKLWGELHTCEFQLSAYCAPYLAPAWRRENTLRLRMIRTELRHRGYEAAPYLPD